MKRNALSVLIVLLLLPLLTGMGALQTQSPLKIPVPAKKYLATFTDQADFVTDCRDVSIDGETFLEGKRGKGVDAIPFENITEVLFLQEGAQLTGIVKLRDGSTMQLRLDNNKMAYGYTNYGTYQIKLSELKKMILRKSW